MFSQKIKQLLGITIILQCLLQSTKHTLSNATLQLHPQSSGTHNIVYIFFIPISLNYKSLQKRMNIDRKIKKKRRRGEQNNF